MKKGFMNKIKTVVIPVAGYGTRFLPATKCIPKEMLNILDRPLIDYAISEAVGAGIENFIFITNPANILPKSYMLKNTKLEKYLTHKNKETILKKINKFNVHSNRIKIINQDKPLGLGNAVYQAKSLLKKEDFAIILPDDLILQNNCTKELINVYLKKNTNVLAVMEVEKRNIKNYGVIKPLKKVMNITEVESLVEKPSSKPPSNFGIVGRYILKNSIFKYLKSIRKGSGDEYQLTDALSLSLKNEKIFASKFRGYRYDCGSKKGFLQAQIACALRDKELSQNFKKMIKKEYDKMKRAKS